MVPTAVAITDSDLRLIAGYEDGSIRIWAIETGRLQRTVNGDTIAPSSVSIEFNGTRFLSGHTDGSVKLWDAVSGTLLTTLSDPMSKTEPRFKAVKALRFRDETTIVAACEDNTVKMWDTSPVRIVRELKLPKLEH